MKVESNKLVINCYDGTEHPKILKETSGTISFNSQLYLENELKTNVKTVASLFNILTWQQVMGSENAANSIHLLQPSYKEIQKILSNSQPECYI